MIAGGGFIPVITIKEKNRIKKDNYNKKKNKFYAYKKIKYIFKIWVQFRLGAIPRLPLKVIQDHCPIYGIFTVYIIHKEKET